ncbi:MAG: hypothetical protein IV107_16515 [Paucibacter sp.]|nr:hypothetical protein [Roseateles sp.]
MKQLTIAQATRELLSLAGGRLNATTQDRVLMARLEQFTTAVQAAITDLQQQVEQLRQDLPKKD